MATLYFLQRYRGERRASRFFSIQNTDRCGGSMVARECNLGDEWNNE
jgi:hypothetical protein